MTNKERKDIKIKKKIKEINRMLKKGIWFSKTQRYCGKVIKRIGIRKQKFPNGEYMPVFFVRGYDPIYNTTLHDISVFFIDKKIKYFSFSKSKKDIEEFLNKNNYTQEFDLLKIIASDVYSLDVELRDYPLIKYERNDKIFVLGDSSYSGDSHAQMLIDLENDPDTDFSFLQFEEVQRDRKELCEDELYNMYYKRSTITLDEDKVMYGEAIKIRTLLDIEGIKTKRNKFYSTRESRKIHETLLDEIDKLDLEQELWLWQDCNDDSILEKLNKLYPDTINLKEDY